MPKNYVQIIDDYTGIGAHCVNLWFDPSHCRTEPNGKKILEPCSSIENVTDTKLLGVTPDWKMSCQIPFIDLLLFSPSPQCTVRLVVSSLVYHTYDSNGMAPDMDQCD